MPLSPSDVERLIVERCDLDAVCQIIDKALADSTYVGGKVEVNALPRLAGEKVAQMYRQIGWHVSYGWVGDDKRMPSTFEFSQHPPVSYMDR